MSFVLKKSDFIVKKDYLPCSREETKSNIIDNGSGSIKRKRPKRKKYPVINVKF